SHADSRSLTPPIQFGSATPFWGGVRDDSVTVADFPKDSSGSLAKKYCHPELRSRSYRRPPRYKRSEGSAVACDALTPLYSLGRGSLSLVVLHRSSISRLDTFRRFRLRPRILFRSGIGCRSRQRACLACRCIDRTN